MQTVAYWVELAKLRARASAEDFEKGQAIVAAGGVMIELANPLRVTAKVTAPGGALQHTDLASLPDGLQWSCSCNDQHDFCAHVVATALVAGQKVPTHHRNPTSGKESMV